MKIVSLADAAKAPFNLDARITYTSPELEVVHLCLAPGQAIPQHSNPFDVVACLIQGNITLNMGETKFELSLFDTVHISKNEQRGFSNEGNSESRLIIIKKF